MRPGVLVLATAMSGCTGGPVPPEVLEPPPLFEQSIVMRADPDSGLVFWAGAGVGGGVPDPPLVEAFLFQQFLDPADAPAGVLPLPFYFDASRLRAVTVLVPRCTEGTSEVTIQELVYTM